jgi:hypothetical protein
MSSMQSHYWQTDNKCIEVHTVNIYTLYSMLKQFPGSAMFITDPDPRSPTELRIRILRFASVDLNQSCKKNKLYSKFFWVIPVGHQSLNLKSYSEVTTL